MASPTFNGVALFDSQNSTGGLFSEGVLDMGGYTKLVQTIHVNGENGNRLIEMGWGDRPWTFTGIMSAPDAATLMSRLNAIQTYINAYGTSTYYTLVTSFGDTFDSCAQIASMTRTPLHVCADGYMTHITVTGIVQGMQPDG